MKFYGPQPPNGNSKVNPMPCLLYGATSIGGTSAIGGVTSSIGGSAGGSTGSQTGSGLSGVISNEKIGTTVDGTQTGGGVEGAQEVVTDSATDMLKELKLVAQQQNKKMMEFNVPGAVFSSAKAVVQDSDTWKTDMNDYFAVANYFCTLNPGKKIVMVDDDSYGDLPDGGHTMRIYYDDVFLSLGGNAWTSCCDSFFTFLDSYARQKLTYYKEKKLSAMVEKYQNRIDELPKLKERFYRLYSGPPTSVTVIESASNYKVVRVPNLKCNVGTANITTGELMPCEIELQNKAKSKVGGTITGITLLNKGLGYVDYKVSFSTSSGGGFQQGGGLQGGGLGGGFQQGGGGGNFGDTGGGGQVDIDQGVDQGGTTNGGDGTQNDPGASGQDANAYIPEDEMEYQPEDERKLPIGLIGAGIGLLAIVGIAGYFILKKK